MFFPKQTIFFDIFGTNSYMLNGMGVHTGVDLEKLIDIGNWISFHLGRTSRSKAGVAITRKREETLPFLSLEQ